jgi:hypothetical protein
MHRLQNAPEYHQANAALMDPGATREQAAGAFMKWLPQAD